MKVDVREAKDKRIPKLLEDMHVKCEWETLEVGDYATDQVIIERKSFDDYVASLIDGRLFSQIDRMSKTDKLCAVVVHDYPRVKHAVTDKQIYGSMAASLVEFGIPVLYVPTLDNAIYLIKQICEKVEQGKLGVPRKYYKRKKNAPWIVRKVSQLLEVPDKTAARLLLRFKSIHGIAQASEEELEKIEGIGDVRARRIRAILNVEVKQSAK